jgi:hypothetical protein
MSEKMCDFCKREILGESSCSFHGGSYCSALCTVTVGFLKKCVMCSGKYLDYRAEGLDNIPFSYVVVGSRDPNRLLRFEDGTVMIWDDSKSCLVKQDPHIPAEATKP